MLKSSLGYRKKSLGIAVATVLIASLAACGGGGSGGESSSSTNSATDNSKTGNTAPTDPKPVVPQKPAVPSSESDPTPGPVTPPPSPDPTPVNPPPPPDPVPVTPPPDPVPVNPTPNPAADEAEPVIDMTGVRNATAGAARIGTANYPVPAGAIFVAPNGSDSAAGTLAAPYATVKKALDKAPEGATIVLRAGNYHEPMLSITRKVTIQPYPLEKVWFDGSSVISSWTSTPLNAGFVWVTSWNHIFPHDPTFTAGAPDGTEPGWQFVNPDYPMAAHPDQVWLDGVAQKQMASLDKVTPGTFYYDEGAKKLYLGSNPNGHIVRASDLQKAIQIQGTSVGSMLRGFGVRRYATPVSDMGTVVTYGTNATFENLAIIDNAATGLHIGAADAQVSNVTVARNGLLGIGGNRTDRLRVKGLLATANTLERFNFAPVSGGFKTAHSRDVQISDSVFLKNQGLGIWLDESSYDMKLFNNDVIGNADSGIQVEISAKALLANNLVVSNKRDGIRIDGTSDIDVWNNTLANNGPEASSKGRNLNITMGPRRWADTTQPGRDPRQPIPPDMTWITGPVIIHNNVIGGGSGNCLVCVEDYSHEFTAAQMGVSTNNNVYQRASATSPTWVAVWSRGTININPAVYTTFSAFSAATSQELNALVLEGSAAWDANYRLTPTVSAAINTVAAPLPSNIATQIGKPATTRQLGVWW